MTECRRTFLRYAAALIGAGFTAGCALAPPFRVPAPSVRRRLDVLAAYTGSPAAGDTEPAWLPVIRTALDQLNASASHRSDATSLCLTVFSADQAPGAYQQQSGGQRMLFINAYFDALAERAATADILLMGGSYLLELERRHLLAPLTALLARDLRQHPSDYYPSVLTLGQMHGEQLLLPLAVLPHLLHFDGGMFRAAGLTSPPPDQPWTWQQLIAAAPTLSRVGLGGAGIPHWPCDVPSLAPEIPIWQAGGDVIGPDGTVMVDQLAAVQGVTFWQDLVSRYQLIQPSVQPLLPLTHPDRPYATVAWGGFLATWFDLPIAYPAKKVADIGEHWEDGLGVAPIPVGAPGGAAPVTKLSLQLGGGISAAGKQPAAAFAALRELEAAAGTSLLLSARRSLATKMLEQGPIDRRLASALGWGMAVGRASQADRVGNGMALSMQLGKVFVGYQNPTPIRPTLACAWAAQVLRQQLQQPGTDAPT
ncbi:MAG: extracellular solute-binding protein [Chloroflexota bacterium]